MFTVGLTSCGFSGFCNMYDIWLQEGFPMESAIRKIFYNEEELNKEGVISFWQQFLKRKENYETKK